MRIITDKGYTLVEVMVTMAIMGAVAIPLTMLLSSEINKMTSDAVLEASTIAANYMDRTLSQRDFIDEELIHQVGSRSYVVERECVSDDQIIGIFIRIKKSEDTKVLFTLYRGVYVPEDRQ